MSSSSSSSSSCRALVHEVDEHGEEEEESMGQTRDQNVKLASLIMCILIIFNIIQRSKCQTKHS